MIKCELWMSLMINNLALFRCEWYWLPKQHHRTCPLRQLIPLPWPKDEELGNHCPTSLIPTKLVPDTRTPLPRKYPQILACQEKAASSASTWQSLTTSKVLVIRMWENKVWEISFLFFCIIGRGWNGQKRWIYHTYNILWLCPYLPFSLTLCFLFNDFSYTVKHH